MTPARLASCNRLLRGISVLEDRNKQELLGLTSKREALQKEILGLVKFIGEQSYADARLLQSMSRRIGTTSNHLRQCQEALVLAYQKDTKLSRSKALILDRIRMHDAEHQEEELSEMISMFVVSSHRGQSSAS